MLAFLLIFATASLTFPVTNAAEMNCSICEVDKFYTGELGYHCFQIDSSTVACTCPDKTYKLNRRCRICDRPNICGDNPLNKCSELGDTEVEFSCFCVDGSDTHGEPCPPTIARRMVRPVELE